MDETPTLLRTSEAARYTRVRPSILRGAVLRGELAAVHPNSRVYLFAKEDLDAWMASIRKGA